jgi:hypothetical protein
MVHHSQIPIYDAVRWPHGLRGCHKKLYMFLILLRILRGGQMEKLMFKLAYKLERNQHFTLFKKIFLKS